MQRVSTSPRRKGLKERLSAMADAVGNFAGNVGEAVARTVQSSAELLRDDDLRKKGANMIANEATKNIAELQKGLEETTEKLNKKLQKGAKSRFGAGARQVKSLLRHLERQIAEFQHQQRLADLELELAHINRQPVDIQIGDQVYEDMPQEMRSRLWYVLLERPDLAVPLRPLCGRRSNQAASSIRESTVAVGAAAPPRKDNEAGQRGSSSGRPGAASAAPRESSSAAASSSGSNPWHVQLEQQEHQQQRYGDAAGSTLEMSRRLLSPPAAPSPWSVFDGQQQQEDQQNIASSRISEGNHCSSSSSSSIQQLVGCNSCQQPGQRASTAIAAADQSSAYSSSQGDSHAPGPSNGDPLAAVHSSSSGWEMVDQQVVGVVGPSGGVEAVETVRNLVHRLGGEAGRTDSFEEHRAHKQRLFTAMLEVPWLPEEGIPKDIDPLGQYARLLDTDPTHVDDMISRDIARTFPEHPMFCDPEGQGRLFRVLQAYSRLDPEVGYCQGMGFSAGVLLMYLPEEPAFRVFSHLLSPSGANLRRLYLPGLDPLKEELSRFELLLASHLPELHQHLLAAALPSVLYASQWIMTQYCCPFPNHFAARLIDVLLQEGHDGVLVRMGLALMAFMAPELLAMDDFEELITHLKVAPLSWPLHTYRRIIQSALDSDISDQELRVAAQIVTDEARRLGRPSSFSTSYLERRRTTGGGIAHELVEVDLGPSDFPGHEDEELSGVEDSPWVGFRENGGEGFNGKVETVELGGTEGGGREGVREEGLRAGKHHSRTQSFVLVGGGSGSVSGGAAAGAGDLTGAGAGQTAGQGGEAAAVKRAQATPVPLVRVSVPESAAAAAQLDAAYLDMVLDLKVLMPGGGETEDAEAP